MAIARHPVLSNAAHGSHLPPSWRTLSELERLPAKTLLAKIEDGTVSPKMQRKDAFGLINGDAAAKHKAKMTPITKLKEEKEELERENADLKEELANAERLDADFPLLFEVEELRPPDVEYIASFIIEKAGEDKAVQIAASIAKQVAERGEPNEKHLN
jgi:hypothetical protein